MCTSSSLVNKCLLLFHPSSYVQFETLNIMQNFMVSHTKSGRCGNVVLCRSVLTEATRQESVR